ncbi:MAG: HEAT repeat domain-containing protein, partial [Thermoguttaceae bacterium]
MFSRQRPSTFCLAAIGLLLWGARLASAQPGPFDLQVDQQVARLQDRSAATRAAAAEALGFLRAYRAQTPLLAALEDDAAEVRLQAAMALAWCGGRASVGPLLEALGDGDWTVRQAAHVALTNLTGMELPLDATAPPAARQQQVGAWRSWWASVPADRPPAEVLALLQGADALTLGYRVTASTTYRGPADVLADGQVGPAYWQTKLVRPPQWVCVDLGREVQVGRVVVHQYGEKFVMTGYEVAVSLDNRQFDTVARAEGKTPVRLVVEFPPRRVRQVKITSLGSVNPTYPSTFFEIEVGDDPRPAAEKIDSAAWRFERGVRALGALGGRGATEAIVKVLGDAPPTQPALRPMVRSGIRALGRLGEEPGLAALIALLDDTMWARNAADA